MATDGCVQVCDSWSLRAPSAQTNSPPSSPFSSGFLLLIFPLPPSCFCRVQPRWKILVGEDPSFPCRKRFFLIGHQTLATEC